VKNIIIITLFFISIVANDNIKMYTEHYPPYNMKDQDGKLVGASIEV